MEQRIWLQPAPPVILRCAVHCGSQRSNAFFLQHFIAARPSEVTGILTTMPGIASAGVSLLSPYPARRGSWSEQKNSLITDRFLKARQHFPDGLLLAAIMLGLVVTPAIGNMRADVRLLRR